MDKLLESIVATSGKLITPISPFPGKTIEPVPESSIADVQIVVNQARQIAEVWASTKISHRIKILNRYHNLLLANREFLEDVIQLETGKARAHASAEIFGVARITAHYTKIAKKFLKPQSRAGLLPFLTNAKMISQPKGVVGIISPWNYPFILSICDAIPALLAGNAIVIRPDNQTVWSAIHAVDLLTQAGLPKGLVTIVTGEGPTIGSELIDHVDYLCFTGSTATGKIVSARASSRLIGASLELGGKNPMVVCADADLETFVEAAIQGCFTSAGQLCISIERIFIHEEIYEKFLAEFVKRVKTLRLGAEIGWDYEIGSLASKTIFDRVSATIEKAISEGAIALTGGQAHPEIGPFVYAPTVLTGVTKEMDIYHDEVFGPCVYVLPFKNNAEAIELANDSKFGLSASVITKNLKQGYAIAKQIEAGSVSVNDGFAAAFGSVAAPMGGMGESGLGRRHGVEGLMRFTEPQTIAIHGRYLVGPKFGLSEKRWNDLLEIFLRTVKRLRIR